MNFLKKLWNKNFLYLYLFLAILLVALFSRGGETSGNGTGAELDLNINYGFLLLKMVLVLVGVVFLAIFVVKFLLPKIYMVGKFSGEEGGEIIKVVGSKVIGNGKTLLLVEVYGELILIGVSGDNIVHLKSFSKDGKKFEDILGRMKEEVSKI